MVTSVGIGTYLTGEGFVVGVPRLYRPDRSRRCLVSIRGAAGDHMTSFANVRGHASRGWPCIEADYGTTSGGRWGRDDALSKITTAWEHMRNLWGVKTDKLAFAIGSGGGIDALNWAKVNSGQTAAIGAAIPAISLTDIHDNNRDGRAADIEAKYGGLAAYNAVKVAKNPPDNVASFTELPMRLVYSANDTITLASITEAFAAAVGSNVLLENVGNQGHGLGAYDATVHNAWLDGHMA